MTKAEAELGPWLSAALSDPSTCDEFKHVINNWFKDRENNRQWLLDNSKDFLRLRKQAKDFESDSARLEWCVKNFSRHAWYRELNLDNPTLRDVRIAIDKRMAVK